MTLGIFSLFVIYIFSLMKSVHIPLILCWFFFLLTQLVVLISPLVFLFGLFHCWVTKVDYISWVYMFYSWCFLFFIFSCTYTWYTVYCGCIYPPLLLSFSHFCSPTSFQLVYLLLWWIFFLFLSVVAVWFVLVCLLQVVCVHECNGHVYARECNDHVCTYECNGYVCAVSAMAMCMLVSVNGHVRGKR